MVTLFDAVTFAWLTFWTVRAARALVHGNRDSIYFVFLVYYFFFGLPLLLDLVLGQPLLQEFYTVHLVQADERASIIYCIYVSMVPVLWWYTARGKATARDREPDSVDHTDLSALASRFRPFLYLLIVSPLFALLLAPNPQIYSSYGAVITNNFNGSGDDASYYANIQLSAVLCILGVTGLIASFRRITRIHIILLLPWAAFAIWIDGKRSIVAFALLLFLYVFWQKGYIPGKRLLLVGVVCGVGLLTFSELYQDQVRAISGSTASFQDRYDNFRVDYGRDQETKLAIFAELHPDQIHILDYRGESVLFDLVEYVPRSIYSSKPYPYAEYMTAAMLGIRPRLLTWGVTTSWLEEAIANFTWFGFIIGPLLISLICRLGDACKNEVIRPLTALVACLLLVLQLPAWMPLLYLWILGLALTAVHSWRQNRFQITAPPALAGLRTQLQRRTTQ